ncbi:MAG: NUDIX hydrolase [Acidimicrobiia bacterium]|nr:NUDIX hydrolase [Acidimicrobiia bacterium]
MPATGFDIIGSRVVCATSFLELIEVDMATPDGAVGKRTVVQVGDAVAVVPVDGDDVVLIRQYRAPINKALLELPAGKLDIPGEDPRTAASRELAEEAGFLAGHLEEVAAFHTSPGFADEHITVFIATDLTAVPANPIGPEEVAAEIVRIPIADLPGRLAEIEDAKTLVGLMAFMLVGTNPNRPTAG